MVTADDFGMIKLFNYPCVVEAAPALAYAGHCSHVACVRFSPDDALCVSAGGHDRALLQFRTAGIAGYVPGAAAPPPAPSAAPAPGLRWGPLDAAGKSYGYLPEGAPDYAASAAPPPPPQQQQQQRGAAAPPTQPQGAPPRAARISAGYLAPVPESPAPSGAAGGDCDDYGSPVGGHSAGGAPPSLAGANYSPAEAQYSPAEAQYSPGAGAGGFGSPAAARQAPPASSNDSYARRQEAERPGSTRSSGGSSARGGAGAAAARGGAGFGSSGSARPADPAAAMRQRLAKGKADVEQAYRRAAQGEEGDFDDAAWAEAAEYSY